MTSQDTVRADCDSLKSLYSRAQAQAAAVAEQFRLGGDGREDLARLTATTQECAARAQALLAREGIARLASEHGTELLELRQAAACAVDQVLAAERLAQSEKEQASHEMDRGIAGQRGSHAYHAAAVQASEASL